MAYVNAFEFLKATTAFSARDINSAIRMLQAEGVPKTETEKYRLLLISPASRLREELLTVREADYEKGVFTDIKAKYYCVDPVAFKKRIENCNEPWDIQGIFAFMAREVIDNEDNVKDAGYAWNRVFSCYSKFAEKANVEDSFTYQFAKTDKDKEECKNAWDGFRDYLIHGIAERAKAYAANLNDKGLDACLFALKKQNKAVFDETLSSLTAVIGNAFMNSNNLEKASGFYKALPDVLKKNTSVAARFIDAINNGIDYLIKNPEYDHDWIFFAWVEVSDEFSDSNDITIKAASAKFHDKVAELMRETNKLDDDEKFMLLFKKVLDIYIYLPEDTVIATDYASKEEYKTEAFIAVLSRRAVSIKVEKIGSKTTAADGAEMWEI
ncbi:MAG: hypothetical protein LBL98_06450, partial [Ruminococcus sp.]|nr:hypothetical protein [Ruminococcus sp.]